MAFKFSKCKPCGGNMWPATASGVVEHPHLDRETLKKTLKLKYRAGQRGWSKAANPRSNSPSGVSKASIRPRRKAYGPF